MLVTALHHVNITVSAELEAATKDFYALVLGLKQIPKPATSRQSGAWYQIGDNQLHLSIEDGVRNASSRHVCFTVSDLHTAEKRFRNLLAMCVPAADRVRVATPGRDAPEYHVPVALPCS